MDFVQPAVSLIIDQPSYGVVDTSLPDIEEERALARELERKTLEELLRLQQQWAKQDEHYRSVLSAVREGDLTVLTPYLQETKAAPLLTSESEKEISSLANGLGMNREKAGISKPIPAGDEAERAVAKNQQLMDDIFGAGKISCIKVQGQDGHTRIAHVGASAAEINAAADMYFAQQSAQRHEAAITQRIDRIVNAEPNQQAPEATAVLLPPATKPLNKSRTTSRA